MELHVKQRGVGFHWASHGTFYVSIVLNGKEIARTHVWLKREATAARLAKRMAQSTVDPSFVRCFGRDGQELPWL